MTAWIVGDAMDYIHLLGSFLEFVWTLVLSFVWPYRWHVVATLIAILFAPYVLDLFGTNLNYLHKKGREKTPEAYVGEEKVMIGLSRSVDSLPMQWFFSLIHRFTFGACCKIRDPFDKNGVLGVHLSKNQSRDRGFNRDPPSTLIGLIPYTQSQGHITDIAGYHKIAPLRKGEWICPHCSAHVWKSKSNKCSCSAAKKTDKEMENLEECWEEETEGKFLLNFLTSGNAFNVRCDYRGARYGISYGSKDISLQVPTVEVTNGSKKRVFEGKHPFEVKAKFPGQQSDGIEKSKVKMMKMMYVCEAEKADDAVCSMLRYGKLPDFLKEVYLNRPKSFFDKGRGMYENTYGFKSHEECIETLLSSDCDPKRGGVYTFRAILCDVEQKRGTPPITRPISISKEFSILSPISKSKVSRNLKFGASKSEFKWGEPIAIEIQNPCANKFQRYVVLRPINLAGSGARINPAVEKINASGTLGMRTDHERLRNFADVQKKHVHKDESLEESATFPNPLLLPSAVPYEAVYRIWTSNNKADMMTNPTFRSRPFKVVGPVLTSKENSIFCQDKMSVNISDMYSPETKPRDFKNDFVALVLCNEIQRNVAASKNDSSATKSSDPSAPTHDNGSDDCSGLLGRTIEDAGWILVEVQKIPTKLIHIEKSAGVLNKCEVEFTKRPTRPGTYRFVYLTRDFFDFSDYRYRPTDPEKSIFSGTRACDPKKQKIIAMSKNIYVDSPKIRVHRPTLYPRDKVEITLTSSRDEADKSSEDVLRLVRVDSNEMIVEKEVKTLERVVGRRDCTCALPTTGVLIPGLYQVQYVDKTSAKAQQGVISESSFQVLPVYVTIDKGPMWKESFQVSIKCQSSHKSLSNAEFNDAVMIFSPDTADQIEVGAIAPTQGLKATAKVRRLESKSVTNVLFDDGLPLPGKYVAVYVTYVKERMLGSTKTKVLSNPMSFTILPPTLEFVSSKNLWWNSTFNVRVSTSSRRGKYDTIRLHKKDEERKGDWIEVKGSKVMVLRDTRKIVDAQFSSPSDNWLLPGRYKVGYYIDDRQYGKEVEFNVLYPKLDILQVKELEQPMHVGGNESNATTSFWSWSSASASTVIKCPVNFTIHYDTSEKHSKTDVMALFKLHGPSTEKNAIHGSWKVLDANDQEKTASFKLDRVYLDGGSVDEFFEFRYLAKDPSSGTWIELCKSKKVVCVPKNRGGKKQKITIEPRVRMVITTSTKIQSECNRIGKDPIGESETSTTSSDRKLPNDDNAASKTSNESDESSTPPYCGTARPSKTSTGDGGASKKSNEDGEYSQTDCGGNVESESSVGDDEASKTGERDERASDGSEKDSMDEAARKSLDAILKGPFGRQLRVQVPPKKVAYAIEARVNIAPIRKFQDEAKNELREKWKKDNVKSDKIESLLALLFSKSPERKCPLPGNRRRDPMKIRKWRAEWSDKGKPSSDEDLRRRMEDDGMRDEDIELVFNPFYVEPEYDPIETDQEKHGKKKKTVSGGQANDPQSDLNFRTLAESLKKSLGKASKCSTDDLAKLFLGKLQISFPTALLEKEKTEEEEEYDALRYGRCKSLLKTEGVYAAQKIRSQMMDQKLSEKQISKFFADHSLCSDPTNPIRKFAALLKGVDLKALVNNFRQGKETNKLRRFIGYVCHADPFAATRIRALNEFRNLADGIDSMRVHFDSLDKFFRELEPFILQFSIDKSENGWMKSLKNVMMANSQHGQKIFSRELETPLDILRYAHDKKKGSLNKPFVEGIKARLRRTPKDIFDCLDMNSDDSSAKTFHSFGKNDGAAKCLHDIIVPLTDASHPMTYLKKDSKKDVDNFFEQSKKKLPSMRRLLTSKEIRNGPRDFVEELRDRVKEIDEEVTALNMLKQDIDKYVEQYKKRFGLGKMDKLSEDMKEFFDLVRYTCERALGRAPTGASNSTASKEDERKRAVREARIAREMMARRSVLRREDSSDFDV